MLSLRARIRQTLVAPSKRCCFRFMGSLTHAHEVPNSVDEQDQCSHLLPWLRQKSGTEITSQLTIGNSVYGRSIYASKPIHPGDCILRIPRSVHLTADSLQSSVSSLLGEGFTDEVKLALAILQHQKLGQASEWAPYISCLPRFGEMHSTILWSDEELEMIKTSLLYETTLLQKAHIEKIYLSLKHVLDRFPEYFEDVTLDKFKHAYNLVDSRSWEVGRSSSMIPFADFFNHDIHSPVRSYFNDDFEHQFISLKYYAPGDEVYIRFQDVPNPQLLLQYGFLIPVSQYDDTILVEINVPQHDHLREMKLDLLYRHSILPRMGYKKSYSRRNFFIVDENVKSSCVEEWGISISLRAFARVVCCTSPQELQQLAMEATEDGGHLARIPLKNKAREIEAHQFLHLKFDDMIQNHTAALESQTHAASPTLSGKCARRVQLARDLLSQDLQILRPASAWLKKYCEALKV